MYYCNIIYFKQIFAEKNNANNINENSNVNSCSNVNDDNDNEADISRHPETTDVEISKRNESNHNIYDEQYVTKLKKTLTKIQMQCNIWKKNCEDQVRYLKQREHLRKLWERLRWNVIF